MDQHFPWIWVVSAFCVGGFLGFIIAALFASSAIANLKHWNRRLQKERDEARKDAKNYRELLKVEQ